VINSGVGGGQAGGTGADGGPVTLPNGTVVAGAGHSVGEACTIAEPCRPGLSCGSGKCEFGHSGAEGAGCVAAGECKDGLQCAAGKCAPAGKGAAGDGCLLDTDCTAGLRCGIVGFAAQCVPQGAVDVGQTCAISTDCYAGLICAPTLAAGDSGSSGTSCAPIPPKGGVPFGIPTGPVLSCDPPSQSNVKAYFQVPGAESTPVGGDFFRLPFPNDARIKGGKIDLKGFPTPGAALLGFDPVQVYLDAITANESGWGTYPTVLFRFSGEISFSSLSAQAGQESPVQYLDITDPQNPGNGGAAWSYSTQGGKYICGDWLAVRHPQGTPLEPGHVYTVYLTTVGKDKSGLPIEPSSELTSLLGTSAPVDPALANAYAAYKPLRDYLKAQKIDPTTILNATVFTTSPVRKPMEQLAAAALAGPAPTASGWVKCSAGAKSPCPQADGNRACGAGTADYDEYHALISLPIFQKGTAPYTASGGNIDSSAPTRTEQVCAALTVPKGTMPTAGWPVAVFAHGTAGSFRDHVRDEVAGALARAKPAVAVLGYDQVQHGPRRGASTDSPNVLFFNFKNPAAARGNPMQGGADVISMGRYAAALSVPASVAGGTAITSDPKGIVFYGHSQGSMHGSLGLPYSKDYSAAVLSGNGASLMHALLSKTAPQNIAVAVPFALGADYDNKRRLFGGENHPVLTILQQWIDPGDPLNFGGVIGRQPGTGMPVKSIFQTYGIGDTYAPPVTLQTYAIAADLTLAAHDPSVTTPDAISNFTELPVPLKGNFAKDGKTVTLAVREYQNASGKDGHFVVFDVPSATEDVARFLSMAAGGQVPQVGK
jgi:hypothetical protein